MRSLEPLPVDDTTFAAYVRYGYVGDDGFTQNILVPITRRVPDDASFVSPAIYFLTSTEEQQLATGRPSKPIQSDCEDEGRVAYSVVAESDCLADDFAAPKVSDWLVRFAEERLGLSPGEYDLSFSGNRSIHLETSRVVPGEEGRLWLKGEAEDFNEEIEGELDTSIYKPKPQFRLAGAQHEETALHKVPIQPDDTREELVRKSREKPDGKTRPIDRCWSTTEPTLHYTAGDGETGPLPDEIDSRILQGYINPKRTTECASPSKPFPEFSPYANTGDGQRSLCIFRYWGGPAEQDGSYYVGGYIRAAVGGDGEYQKRDRVANLKLSSRDVEKWDFEEGDVVAVIGGKSRSSRMFALDTEDSFEVRDALVLQGREAAFKKLEEAGYDTGTTGHKGPRRRTDVSRESSAERIKRGIDAGDLDPTYDRVLRVSCRLLRNGGWDAAWSWIKRTYGSDFDREETHKRLETLVNTYGDYSQVQVPDRSGDSSTRNP